jgi:hypothetical protein
VLASTRQAVSPGIGNPLLHVPERQDSLVIEHTSISPGWDLVQTTPQVIRTRTRLTGHQMLGRLHSSYCTWGNQGSPPSDSGRRVSFANLREPMTQDDLSCQRLILKPLATGICETRAFAPTLGVNSVRMVVDIPAKSDRQDLEDIFPPRLERTRAYGTAGGVSSSG